MTPEKLETLNRFKHEILLKALTRHDDSSIYIFMPQSTASGEGCDLLITDIGKGMRKSFYKFYEDGDRCFILIENKDYEILLPDTISDEESFSFQLKDPKGNVIPFDDYF